MQPDTARKLAMMDELKHFIRGEIKKGFDNIKKELNADKKPQVETAIKKTVREKAIRE